MSAAPAKEQAIVDAFRTRFGDSVRASKVMRKERVKVLVDSARIVEAADFAKDMGFDHIQAVSGTDYPKTGEIEVVYVVGSQAKEEYHPTVLLLATRVPRSQPRLPTLIPIWPGAEYHEREQYEMLGIIFDGHPKLEKLLLPEDWSDIPPLRKDFKLRKWHEEERAAHGLIITPKPESPKAAPPAKPTPTPAPPPQPAAPSPPKPQLPAGVDANALDGIIKLLDMRGTVELTQARAIIKLRTKQENPDLKPYIEVLAAEGKAKLEGERLVKL